MHPIILDGVLCTPDDLTVCLRSKLDPDYPCCEQILARTEPYETVDDNLLFFIMFQFPIVFICCRWLLAIVCCKHMMWKDITRVYLTDPMATFLACFVMTSLTINYIKNSIGRYEIILFEFAMCMSVSSFVDMTD